MAIPDRFAARADRIRRELVGGLRDGYDVGELLVSAVVAAQEWLDAHPTRLWPEDPYPLARSLTDNRPGSWEASYIDQVLTSGGYEAGSAP